MKKLLLAFNLLALNLSMAQLQSPKEFLGYELGTQFSRHHQVIDYVKHVAGTSDYVKTKSYGRRMKGEPFNSYMFPRLRTSSNWKVFAKII